MMNADWIDDFVAAEKHLAQRTDALTDRPAQLPIPDGPADAKKWRTIVLWLQEKGWRTAVDNTGELWFYAPGPLTDPGDVARSQN